MEVLRELLDQVNRLKWGTEKYEEVRENLTLKTDNVIFHFHKMKTGSIKLVLITDESASYMDPQDAIRLREWLNNLLPSKGESNAVHHTGH